MEIIPIQAWSLMAVENNKIVQLQKTLQDTNFSHIGYVHPKAMERIYRNFKLEQKFDQVIKEKSWISFKKYVEAIMEKEQFLVNEIGEQVMLGPKQG